MKNLFYLMKNKKKATVITICLFVIFIGSSLMTYKSFVKVNSLRDYIVYQTKVNSTEEITLDGNCIEQPVKIVSDSMTGIGLKFNNVDSNSTNEFNVVIKDDKDHVVFTTLIKESELIKDEFYNVRFIASGLKVGSFYKVMIESQGPTHATLIMTHENESEYHLLQNCKVNDKECKSAIAYSVIDGNCVHARYFYFLIVLILSVLIVAVYLMYIYNVKFYKASFVIILLMGMVYTLVIPQFAVPDEHTHFLTTYSQSSVLLNKKAFDKHGNVILYEDSANTVLHIAFPDTAVYTQEFDGLIGREKFKLDKPYISRAPLTLGTFGYFPQVIGVSLGRILGMNGIQIGVLGRFFALLLFAFAVSFSIKILPSFYRGVLFTISIFPMTLQQVCSYNYDSVLFTACFLLFAYLMYLIYEKEKISKVDIVVVCFLTIVIAPIKIVYLPILSLGLLIPHEKFNLKHGKNIVIGLLVVLSLFTYFAVMKFNQGFWNVHESNTSSLIEYNTFTISQILRNPIYEIVIFVATIQRFFAEYVTTMITGPLGWLEITVPHIQLAGYLMLLFYSLFSVKHKSKMDTKVKVCCGVFSLVMFIAIILALQLSWTANDSLVVVGVQGRYFLPFLPMIMLVFKDLFYIQNQDFRFILYYGNVILQICEIFAILSIVLAR